MKEPGNSDLQKQRRDREIRDLALVMASDAGRRLVGRVLLRSSVGHDPFNSNGLVMARTVGAQEVGRTIFNDLLQACPDLYFKMVKEHEIDLERDYDEAQKEAEILR